MPCHQTSDIRGTATFFTAHAVTRDAAYGDAEALRRMTLSHHANAYGDVRSNVEEIKPCSSLKLPANAAEMTPERADYRQVQPAARSAPFTCDDALKMLSRGERQRPCPPAPATIIECHGFVDAAAPCRHMVSLPAHEARATCHVRRRACRAGHAIPFMPRCREMLFTMFFQRCLSITRAPDPNYRRDATQ